MEHIYREHYKRKVTSLNGDWMFCIDPNNKGKTEKWFKKFPQEHNNINVPGCWNLQNLDLFEYYGVAWYKKEFVTEKCDLKIEFGAVSGECEVYLDGEFIGSHYGGWTAFSFYNKVEAGVHTVTVRVDNLANEIDTVPFKTVDWFHYGGFFRSVEISEFFGEYITSHKITYTLSDDLSEAAITTEFAVDNCENEIFTEIQINGHSLYKNVLPVIDGKVTVPAICLEKIKLWDIGDGTLYTIHIILPNDDIVEKIGFREIKVENTRFYLNRKEVFFKGVNRHEEHTDWGFAVPANIGRRDIEIIKDLGCNMVRGSHYPQSQTWIDYLDREGILCWSEIPMWGWHYGEETLSNQKLIDRIFNMHREMVKQYYHHPSIVIWGMFNEIDTREEGVKDIARQIRELLTSVAPDRLITYATDKFFDDICLEYADFIAINNYYGWYTATLGDWKEFIEGARDVAKAKGVGDKPIIMSEFGCPSIHECSEFSSHKWSMQYQSEFLKTVIDLCDKTDGFCGTLVWQFADTKSDHGLAKVRLFNNKGILDEYRKPKMAYYTVKELFSKIK